MKKKILIYDDEKKQTERFENALKQTLKKVGQDQDFVIQTLSDEALQCSIKTLQKKQVAFRSKENFSDETTEFDDTSIFIVDYDLLKR